MTTKENNKTKLIKVGEVIEDIRLFAEYFKGENDMTSEKVLIILASLERYFKEKYDEKQK